MIQRVRINSGNQDHGDSVRQMDRIASDVNAAIQGLLTLDEAAKLIPDAPSIATLSRWIRHGIRTRKGKRVVLRAQRIGRKWYTKAAWLADFSNTLTMAEDLHYRQKTDRIRLPRAIRDALAISLRETDDDYLDSKGI